MKTRQEQGQAIVIMAFAVIALAAVVGLAIDGGRLYTDRRQAQNTADAAAMAGGRELAQLMLDSCKAGHILGDAGIAAAIIQFAENNGVEISTPNSRVQAAYVDKNDNQVGWVGYGVPGNTAGIQVRVVTTDTTTFLKVVGQNTYRAAATATAVTDFLQRETNHMSGQGMLPIGVWEGVIYGLEPGETFTVWDKGEDYCGDEDCDFSGDHIPGSMHGYLNMNWIYNDDFYGGSMDRALKNSVGNQGCAFNADGSVDVPGTGLRGYAGEDVKPKPHGDGIPDCPYPYDIYSGERYENDGDWIHGDPGTRASTLDAISESHPVGSEVWMPVFDRIRDPGWMNDTFGHGSNYWPNAAGGNNASNFHIIGFVKATIREVSVTGEDKYVTVDFVDAVIMSGEASSGITLEDVEGGDGLSLELCAPLTAVSLKH